MTGIAATEAEVEGEQSTQSAHVALVARPYPPSLVNRIIAGIRRLPVPAWALYGALAVLLVAIEIAVKWLDGTFPAGFQLIHVMLPVYAMVILPAIHYIDDVSARALAATRPLLTVDEQTYRTLHYRLITLPAYRTFTAGAGGLLTLLLLTLVRPGDTDARLGMITSPLATVVEWSLQFFVWMGVGIVSYHIAHQLLIVNEIYTRHTRISLFTLGPLYAFSRLTAVNALFTTAVVAVASLALSSLAGTLQWAVVGGGALLLAAATFVAPLWGAHRLLAHEKGKQQDALGQRIERAIAALQERVDSSDLAGVGDLKTALDGLIVGKKELDDISTWPWQPETLRGVATGLLAPLVIWLITKLLERIAFF
jgi:hypothetical protein